jgi:hypothetical protein
VFFLIWPYVDYLDAPSIEALCVLLWEFRFGFIYSFLFFFFFSLPRILMMGFLLGVVDVVLRDLGSDGIKMLDIQAQKTIQFCRFM